MQVSASLEGIGTVAMFCDDFSCQRMCHMNIKLWSGSRASSETRKNCVLRTPSSDNWFPRMEKFGRGSSDEALHLRAGACVWSRLGRVSQWTNPTGIKRKDIVLLFKFSISRSFQFLHNRVKVLPCHLLVVIIYLKTSPVCRVMRICHKWGWIRSKLKKADISWWDHTSIHPTIWKRTILLDQK